MTLDELRDALEMAKLSARTDPPEAALRNLLDWCESVQTFLEITHGEPEEALPSVGPAPMPGTPKCQICGDSGVVMTQPGDPVTKVGQVWETCLCKK